MHFLLLPSFNLLPTVRAILRALTSGDRFVSRHTVIALSAYGGLAKDFEEHTHGYFYPEVPRNRATARVHWTIRVRVALCAAGFGGWPARNSLYAITSCR